MLNGVCNCGNKGLDQKKDNQEGVEEWGRKEKLLDWFGDDRRRGKGRGEYSGALNKKKRWECFCKWGAWRMRKCTGNVLNLDVIE